MKGRSFAKLCIILAYASIFVGYIAPRLNALVLNPAFPEEFKYILDFVLLAFTTAVIYVGMSASRKPNEKQIQEIRDEARQEARIEFSQRETLPTGGNKSVPFVFQGEHSQAKTQFGENRIKVRFSGEGTVKLSDLEDVKAVEFDVPKTVIKEELPTQEEPIEDELDDLLKTEAPTQQS